MDGSSTKIEYEIFIDTDGVLANFDLKASQIIGAPIGSISSSRLWRTITEYNTTVEPFFESLPKMQGADELVQFIATHFSKYYNLTATGFTPPDAAEQKIKWISKTFPVFNGKVLTVRKSGDKAKYAASNHVLIDDREKSIQPWVNAGGIGILYTSAEDAISKLEGLLHQKKYISPDGV